MPNKITTRDIEAISAYLDNELQPRERARLEARLRAEPQMRAALDELNQTRTLLRNVPQVRAPRNFTLTPEAAPRPAFSFRLLPTLQFATVLAAILLVVVVAGDASGVLSARPVFTTAQSSPAPEAFSIQDTAVDTEEVLRSMEATMAAEPSEKGLEGSATEAVGEEIVESLPAAESPAEEPALGVGAASAAPSEPPPGERLGTSSPGPSQQQVEPSPTSTTEEVAPLVAAPLPTETPVPPPTEVPDQNVVVPVPGLRAIEISLAVVFILAGIGVVALRRRFFG